MNALTGGSFTRTHSLSDTFSLARLNAIMPEIGADFFAPASAELISFEMATAWAEDIAFVLRNRACNWFQIKCEMPNGGVLAVHYTVKADGSLHESSTAGGKDYSALPAGTKVRLIVDLDYNSPNIGAVNAYTQRRGWGSGAQAVSGTPMPDRAYSKEGYGVQRGTIGNWP